MNQTHKKFLIHTGHRIMILRTSKHYTREYLAEIADISPKYLYEIEMGLKNCSAYILYRLAKALEITPDFLMEEEHLNPSENDFLHTLQLFDDSLKEKLDSLLKIVYEIRQA